MKRYFTILNILFLTGVIYFSVQVFYKITAVNLDLPATSKITGKKVSTLKDDSRRPLSHYNTIAERNLFHTKQEEEKESKQIDIETLEQTDLKLKLLGTVTGDKKNAYAVIEEIKGREQNLYREGDAIQSATVKMILRKKVVLTVNGKDEILEMDQLPVTPSSKKPVGKSRSNSQNITVKRSQIESAVKNVNQLMRQVKIRPHFMGGKPDGLSLTGIKSNSIFHEMGLKSGDIVTGVNGENLESVDDVFKFYADFKSASSVKLDIKRKGRLKTLYYNIE